MKNKTRILKISAKQIYYTTCDSLSLADTNLIDGIGLFRYNQDIYWEVGIIVKGSESGVFEIKVIDYDSSKIAEFEKQEKRSEVKYFRFTDLEWNKLEPQLQSYQRSALQPILTKEDRERYISIYNSRIKHELDREDVLTKHVNHQDDEFIEETNVIRELQENFTYKYNDAEFKDGYVLVYKKFDFSKTKIELRITNSFIRPEFDYIKNYFPKVFKEGKSFNVSLSITIKGDEIINYEASSPEIEAIDANVIETIKEIRTNEIPQIRPNDDNDQSLFSAEEIMSLLGSEKNDNGIFSQDGQEIIDKITLNTNVGRRKQLQYLSGLKQSSVEKIRFTLRPLFGFLFVIEGDFKNYFCWELLNSHATYIWSVSKIESLGNQLERIEKTINSIRKTGREKYKTAYKAREIDNDLEFKTIYHNRKNTANGDEFLHWKDKLEELLS
ncbi:MAG: hypothetical protein ACOC22_02515 [bacterium]